MDADTVNATATGLSAVAAIFAVVVAGVSIWELRRIDGRAVRRETNERDDALQVRLEALYPDLYRVFGVPIDQIPTRLRPSVVSFFGLYADAFTAHRDGLLPEKDAQAFLEEFDWWLGSPNGSHLWTQLRSQSWPDGFIEHVDAVPSTARPYGELGNRPSEFGWRADVPGVLEFQENPDAELLFTANWTLVSLREEGHAEFPPASLDADLARLSDAGEHRAAQLMAYGTWVTGSETAVWGRWVAVLNGRVIGHVAVCEPHAYVGTRHELLDLDPPGSALEVARLFVDPRLQRRGLATELLSRAVSFIHDFGCTPVLAVLEESSGARAMYEKAGWTVATQFSGVQGNNVLMKLPR